MIHILTDSTADLSKEIISKYNIKLIPLAVTLGNKVYRDGIDITTQDLFQLVDKTGTLPTTSAPSVAEFVENFNLPGQYIYLGISSKLSACCQNAFLASQESEVGRINVIDSLNLSTGIGLLALRAAEMVQTGCSIGNIISDVTNRISKVRTSFVIDKFDYLYKGGRCTAMQSIVGSILQIHPVIEVKSDGTLGIKDKVRGSRRKAIDAMFGSFVNNLPQVDLHRIFITHSGCKEDANYLEDKIRSICTPEEVCITLAGSVIASHCGPNTIGILYMLN
jgi:DegV family protein with EDD domain